MAAGYQQKLPGERAWIIEFDRGGSFGTARYSGYASVKLNNAIVLHERLYFDRLELFEEIFQSRGGDLRRTIRLVIDAAAPNADDPYAAISRLLAPR